MTRRPTKIRPGRRPEVDERDRGLDGATLHTSEPADVFGPVRLRAIGPLR